jgi:hypothetical protein
MMVRLVRALLAVAGCSALLVATATSALAYQGEVAANVTVSVPSGPLPCGTAFAVTATVLDANGAAVPNATVTWSFMQTLSPEDRITEPTSMTNADGVATTHVVLACVLGERQIQAQVAGTTGMGGAVLAITATGLPNTSTEPSRTPGGAGGPVAIQLAGAVGVLIVAAVYLRRRTATGRETDR